MSILLRFQVARQGYCPKWALHFLHFPGLSYSISGFRVHCKGIDSVACAFCALSMSQGLRHLGVWLAHYPKWAMHLNHLLGPGYSVSWICCESIFSGVSCVSSGGLISCDPPGRCQSSRTPGRHSQQLADCSQFVGGCQSLGLRLPFAFWLWLSHTYLSA